MKKLLFEDILKLRPSEEQIKSVGRHPVSVMLHNIRSLYNVGSIFRTCDSALAGELILCGYTPHPPRKEIEKTALGSVDTVPWHYKQNVIEAIEMQKMKNVKVIAAEITDSGRNYSSLLSDDFPLCLVFGNEITGVGDDVLRCCDDAIEIPMYGVKHSLNVGVAAGIALFEAVRLWHLYNK